MKALIKDIDGIGLTLREVEKPTVQANEVLIKIKSTAICGTDLHILDLQHVLNQHLSNLLL